MVLFVFLSAETFGQMNTIVNSRGERVLKSIGI